MMLGESASSVSRFVLVSHFQISSLGVHLEISSMGMHFQIWRMGAFLQISSLGVHLEILSLGVPFQFPSLGVHFQLKLGCAFGNFQFGCAFGNHKFVCATIGISEFVTICAILGIASDNYSKFETFKMWKVFKVKKSPKMKMPDSQYRHFASNNFIIDFASRINYCITGNPLNLYVFAKLKSPDCWD